MAARYQVMGICQVWTVLHLRYVNANRASKKSKVFVHTHIPNIGQGNGDDGASGLSPAHLSHPRSRPKRIAPFSIQGSPSHDLHPFIKLPVGELRCERCYGRRSASYHHKHACDPVTYPPVGICSRRRTDCAVTKERLQSGREIPSWVYELPAG